MKREELKAYDGESIYRVLECTPHNDDELHLEECFNNKSEFKFYEKADADKVMDGYEQRINDLEAENERLKAQLPDWISVKDRLPMCDGYFALIVDAVNKLYGILGRDVDGVLTQFTTGPGIEATHWVQLPLPLPLPLTTEEAKEGT